MVPFVLSFVRFAVNFGFVGSVTAVRLLLSEPGELEFSLHLFLFAAWALVYRRHEYTLAGPLVPVAPTVVFAAMSTALAVLSPEFASHANIPNAFSALSGFRLPSATQYNAAAVHVLWVFVALGATFGACRLGTVLLSLRNHLISMKFAEQIELSLWGAITTTYTVVLGSVGVVLLGIAR